MQNFVHRGDVIPVTAPAGGVSSGDGVLVGALFGVAAYDAAAGAEVEIQVEGVVTLPKNATQATTEGVRLYWDDTNNNVTTTATGNKAIGVATQAMASAATTVNVKLMPNPAAVGV